MKEVRLASEDPDSLLVLYALRLINKIMRIRRTHPIGLTVIPLSFLASQYLKTRSSTFCYYKGQPKNHEI
jgi:hypothetical protein